MAALPVAFPVSAGINREFYMFPTSNTGIPRKRGDQPFVSTPARLIDTHSP